MINRAKGKVLYRRITQSQSHILVEDTRIEINSCDRERFKSNMDGGGGDSFDPCECICSHEGAMRRLISLVNINSIYI